MVGSALVDGCVVIVISEELERMGSCDELFVVEVCKFLVEHVLGG